MEKKRKYIGLYSDSEKIKNHIINIWDHMRYRNHHSYLVKMDDGFYYKDSDFGTLEKWRKSYGDPIKIIIREKERKKAEEAIKNPRKIKKLYHLEKFIDKVWFDEKYKKNINYDIFTGYPPIICHAKFFPNKIVIWAEKPGRLIGKGGSRVKILSNLLGRKLIIKQGK